MSNEQRTVGSWRRLGTAVLGGALLGVGAALLVLPGPGLVLVVAGLSVLARQYEWAHRLHTRALARVRPRRAVARVQHDHALARVQAGETPTPELLRAA